MLSDPFPKLELRPIPLHSFFDLYLYQRDYLTSLDLHSDGYFYYKNKKSDISKS